MYVSGRRHNASLHQYSTFRNKGWHCQGVFVCVSVEEGWGGGPPARRPPPPREASIFGRFFAYKSFSLTLHHMYLKGSDSHLQTSQKHFTLLRLACKLRYCCRSGGSSLTQRGSVAANTFSSMQEDRVPGEPHLIEAVGRSSSQNATPYLACHTANKLNTSVDSSHFRRILPLQHVS